jgi:hypothetical protein
MQQLEGRTFTAAEVAAIVIKYALEIAEGRIDARAVAAMDVDAVFAYGDEMERRSDDTQDRLEKIVEDQRPKPAWTGANKPAETEE